MAKEYRIERTLWEKVCKKLFKLIYRFYKPKIGCKRIRVNKPFKYYVNGELSTRAYVYTQGRTNSLTNIGLFEVLSNGGWRRFYRDDWFYMGSGVHCEIEYVEQLEIQS